MFGPKQVKNVRRVDHLEDLLFGLFISSKAIDIRKYTYSQLFDALDAS
jgi:hypothetical protein